MAVISLLPEVQAFLARHHGHYINGENVNGDGPRIAVINPATGKEIASIADATQEEVNSAVESSRKAFDGTWASTTPAERGNILLRLADLFTKNREQLAQIETSQSGKTIQISRAFEVDQAVNFLRYYAGAATRITGETITPSLPGFNGERYSAFTRREAVGVVVGIVPWNFSIMIAVWKFASALATGCTSIIKASQFTPLTMLRIAELATEAGLPDGVLNVVSGGGNAGRQLIAHDGTDKVSFTGSVPTGIAVGRSAIDAKLTRATLELGGKNSVGFLSDVDADKAVTGILEAGFVHQGQVCAAGERFFIHRSRIDETLEKLSQALATLKIGDPMDDETEFGPLANKAHFDKINEFFRQTRSEGDRVVYGGETLAGPGYFVKPTVIRVDSSTAHLLNEETFGPVATFYAYDDEEELIQLFNDTPYGLTASLWTNDLSKALNYVPRIKAGTVWVNMHTLLDPAVPFGGMKESGIGREFGSAFIDDYTELKSVIIRH
ncbi:MULTISPECIES: aldehyde dehydrogenase family protein [Klebsiella]|uniref:Aldehyde dehydrogenase n=1 Tax=Klebsiella variicola TaxID=244366 RepID=A0ABD7PA45_KLEVA|nr:aldehyde dehydrogenase family protein [Klebsiella variicola]MCD9672365.1 aldehyde dehydrogenase family protein [Klebsiella variicola subsp. variicola]MCK6050117.1 aldehyde dehydrogenase family protein [Klebsiella variicola]PXL32393.1 NAD-dependent phenylacetaldehyde dehydrogenase [Klebsiella variicola]SXF96996.1 aldehyde dehydrogenase [Klebsiella variicola]